MNTPQIIMIVFFIIEFYATVYRCVKRDGKVFQAITAAFLRIGTLATVLYYGGFWK